MHIFYAHIDALGDGGKEDVQKESTWPQRSLALTMCVQPEQKGHTFNTWIHFNNLFGIGKANPRTLPLSNKQADIN